jgi:pimeloyl-ACP methyl ester carboxylesterase
MKHSPVRARWYRPVLAGAAVLAVVTLVLAQDFAPPPSRPPRDADLKAIKARTEKLRKAITSLRRQNVRDPWLAELEIYHKAATWVVEHNEFYQPAVADWTLEALDRGLLRASQVAQGETPWVNARGHAVVRAYRSRVDGSVQPYAVTLPARYGEDKDRRWRLDVVLHGRDPSLTEVKFLHQFNGDKDAPRDQPYVRIDIFGRGNNAYRWAGETDILEAVNHFVSVERILGREQLLDPARRVLRGFSMGGAGTWHIGLHRPDRWCLLGPGAGFTTTKGYVPKLGRLTPAEEACLHIYDAVDYAENVFDVPVVAYGGSLDPQLQAAKNIEARLKELKIAQDRMELIEAPDLKHKFPPEWQAKAEKAYAQRVAEGRKDYPTRVRFVTYTLKYPSCDWVEILGLDRHYTRALVDAEKTEKGFTVKTANVRCLHLRLPEGAGHKVTVDIDGQTVQARAWQSPDISLNVYLQRRDGRWVSVLPQKLATERARQAQKVTGLQGPIDDAFTDSFLCVRGTGERGWHAATQKYADANLDRFIQEWGKYMRGKLPVKDDVDVNDDDIASRHLILFGDPASNSLIAAVVDDLPLRWTRDTLQVAGKTYDAADHVPVLVYPSPLNAQRYVVLNSGHTFHASDFEGTNALLYPRLGDYAVLKVAPTAKDPLAATVAASGLYDDYWKIPRR